MPVGKYYNHMSLRELVRSLGEIPDDFRVICVERSPYYKVISLANWSANSAVYRDTGAIQNVDIEGIRTKIDQLLESGAVKRVYNRHLYVDANDVVRAELLRFENLGAEYEKLMLALGVSQPLPLPHVKKGLQSERLNVVGYLRRDQIEKIHLIFEREFEDFGYAKVAL